MSMSLESQIKAGRVVAGMTFNQKVWALCARVPKGKVTTYGAIARALGCRGARAIGNAMNRNPYAPAVPCHRVVGSDGRLTGFAGGLPKKEAMLRAEGIEIRNGRVSLAALHEFEAEECASEGQMAAAS
jgi:methylated-DNA-[protein]-cysteine S-methyltransferase